MLKAALEIDAPRAPRASARQRWARSAVVGVMLMSGARGAVPAPPSGLPQIEVEAQRRGIEKRVDAFIAAITPRNYADSLARWHHGICPVVVGPPPDQIDQIIARLAQVSSAARVALLPNPCKANLYIIETAYPEKLLKVWSKRDHLLFGKAMPAAIDKFLNTPRPVRVWYNTVPADKPVDDDLGPEPLGGLIGPSSVGAGVNAASLADTLAATRGLEFSEVQRFTSVIVIVDIKRTEGTQLGQLADYVALVGLSKINLDADLVGAPSILQLFTTSARNSAAQAPSGLTVWDQDYLQGLYFTRQSSRLQRSAIADLMVHDIVH